MTQIRALLFNIYFFGLTFLICTLAYPVVLVRRAYGRNIAKSWVTSILVGLKALTGLGVVERGREQIPDGPCFIVSKHQSALETLALFRIFPRPTFILKKELVKIPLFGTYLLASDQIAVDRSAGASALKQMVEQAGIALKNGCQVIIFPEGTRTPPGSTRPYHPGIYALHKAFPEVPVVPVALNSGMFWRRNAFTKFAGDAVFEYLPPMETGMDRKHFMSELKNRIDQKSSALEAEAAEHYQLPAPQPERDVK